MKLIEKLRAEVERAERTLERATGKLHAALLAASPVKPGDIVYATNTTWLGRKYKVDSVDIDPWHEIEARPAVYAHPVRKDGSFSKAKHYLGSSWRTRPL